MKMLVTPCGRDTCRLSLACFRAYHHARKGSIRLGTVSPSCTEGLWFLCACVHIHGDEDYLHHQGGLRPPPVPKRAARKFHRRHPALDRAEAPRPHRKSTPLN